MAHNMPKGIPAARYAAMLAEKEASAVSQPEPTVGEDAVPETFTDVIDAVTPEAELTPEQRRIRDLENQLALERGKRDVELELEEPTNVGADGNILIHFLEDGLTANGQLFYRGQEVEFEPGSRAYKDTCDRFGRSWLELTGDDFGQVERWGKVMFRPGPWPGKSYLDAAKETFEALKPYKGTAVKPPTEAELATAQAAEDKRRRAAPRLAAR